jgi:hypothetical protein
MDKTFAAVLCCMFLLLFTAGNLSAGETEEKQGKESATFEKGKAAFCQSKG